jgi:osmoprotectant transport system permease protein
MGLSERSVLTRVELPLALPLIAAGLRTAAVQVVATATLAALVGGGGLGTIINSGFGRQDTGQIVAGGILVAALALVTEGVLALVQRAVTPGSTLRPRRRTAPKSMEAADAVSLS